MIRSYTAAQMRAVEAIALADTGDGALMRRAAWAVGQAALDALPTPRAGRRAVLLTGGGNNGGDALYAGTLLRRRGIGVTAVLAVPSRVHRAGLAALRRAGGTSIAWDDRRLDRCLAEADLIIDGLVGLGSRPGLRAPLDLLVARASDCPGWRLAVDLPSGVDADTGAVDGPAFRADETVTIGGIKTGLLLADAHTGLLRVAIIGMDPAPTIGHDAQVMTDADVRRLLPAPGARDNKYSRGVVGIVAGSDDYPGAALLSAGGAVRLRPGLVRFAGAAHRDVVARFPEVVGTGTIGDAGRVQAWTVGPGMGTDGAALDRLRRVLAQDVPVIVDADGLNLLAGTPSLLHDRRRRGTVTVLTPHGGEFARLFPEIDQADRLAAVRDAARRTGTIVLLKGHRTVIADPAGAAFINTSGTAWLATAGSGDVLAGMIGSALASGADPLQAVAVAAHMHGRAGERAHAAGRAGASALLEMLADPRQGAATHPAPRSCGSIEP